MDIMELELGKLASFAGTTYPSYLLVDCATSLGGTLPMLAYRQVPLDEVCRQQEGYSFLSLWPYPILDFGTEREYLGSDIWEGTEPAVDKKSVQVDATTLWLACKACAAKLEQHDVLPQKEHRLIVELPFAQGRRSYSTQDLHDLRDVCKKAARYLVFLENPGKPSIQFKDYPAFFASGWHFMQIAFVEPGTVHVVHRLAPWCGQYWLPINERNKAESYSEPPGYLPPHKWEITVLEKRAADRDVDVFAIAPMEALLRAALEGVWILGTQDDICKFVFWGPDEFRMMGYRSILNHQLRTSRYHGALLRTLLATTTHRPTEPSDLRNELLLPLREQAITLGVHLRHFIPRVDPTIALCMALGVRLSTSSRLHSSKDASGEQDVYNPVTLMVKHLGDPLQPYWFGVLSTRRPLEDVPTFMSHWRCPAFPEAFPQGIEFDLPPAQGSELGWYFKAYLKVIAGIKFSGSVFPVSESASQYKGCLARAIKEGLHLVGAYSDITIHQGTAALQDNYRMLLLGEWLPAQFPRLVTPSQIEQTREAGSDDCGDEAFAEFMPQRVLLIRRRCTCSDTEIEELIRDQSWQQVAVFSFPRGWWEEHAQGATKESFRMSQPGHTKQHECRNSHDWTDVEEVSTVDEARYGVSERRHDRAGFSDEVESVWSTETSLLQRRYKSIWAFRCGR